MSTRSDERKASQQAVNDLYQQSISQRHSIAKASTKSDEMRKPQAVNDLLHQLSISAVNTTATAHREDVDQQCGDERGKPQALFLMSNIRLLCLKSLHDYGVNIGIQTAKDTVRQITQRALGPRYTQ
jgi:hypothetical protein